MYYLSTFCCECEPSANANSYSSFMTLITGTNSTLQYNPYQWFPIEWKIYWSGCVVNLKLKPSKCHLLQQKVTFLGFMVSKDGVGTDPDKIAAIRD